MPYFLYAFVVIFIFLYIFKNSYFFSVDNLDFLQIFRCFILILCCLYVDFISFISLDFIFFIFLFFKFWTWLNISTFILIRFFLIFITLMSLKIGIFHELISLISWWVSQFFFRAWFVHNKPPYSYCLFCSNFLYHLSCSKIISIFYRVWLFF